MSSSTETDSVPAPDPETGLVQIIRDDDPYSPQRMRIKAMDYLARREHGCNELKGKLVAKDCPEAIAIEVVARLAAENLVSDERYTENFINSKRNRGQGPARIRQKLREKGINDSLIDDWLDPRDPQWLQTLKEVRLKKFGSSPPTGYKERARQARFLQYRGFATDQIFQILGGNNELD
ncbi:MAG: regulatory protein RecX [Proteobacteria bacterium]|nr:regulatory protein RecX [Pseudomonadota bacterium]